MGEMPNNIEIPMHILVAEREVPQKWEYKITGYPGTFDAMPPFIDRLNALGEEGWQVCQKLNDVHLLLIRQIVPPAEELEESDEEPGE